MRIINKLYNEYDNLHSDPEFGAYYYVLTPRSLKLHFLKSNEIYEYAFVRGDRQVMLRLPQSTPMKLRVYLLKSGCSILICINQNVFVGQVFDYQDLTPQYRLHSTTLYATDHEFANCIIPEDFDLFKHYIDKSTLAIKQYDRLYTSYVHKSIGANTVYRQTSILHDLKYRGVDLNDCYVYDNFILVDRPLEDNYYIYPYELMYNYDNNAEALSFKKFNGLVFSNPNSVVANGFILDIRNKTWSTLKYIYVFRGNIL